MDLQSKNGRIERRTGLQRAGGYCRFAAIGFCVFAFVVQFATAALESDDEFLGGLRQRRLFQLAERFCSSELGSSALTPQRRSQLVLELVRTHGEHALYQTAGERDAELQRAQTIASEYVREHADDPRRILVQVQASLAVVAMAELQRQEAELNAVGSDLGKARNSLREANRQLEQLDKEVSGLIVARSRKPAAKNSELAPAELTSLQNNLRIQLARTYRNQGLTYDRGSEDRFAAIAQALELLRTVARQLDPDEPLVARLQLDEAIGLRHVDKFDEATALLNQLVEPDQPDAFQALVRAEQVRLALGQGKTSVAAKLASQPLPGAPNAELEFAGLEVIVALWQEAERNEKVNEAGKWQRQAEQMLVDLEQRHGTYWRHRGELLVVRSAAGGAANTNLDLLIRSGDSLYLNKQWDEAVAAYDQAATMAQSVSRPDREFDVAYRAALIRQNQKQHREAAERLRAISLRWSDDERSHQAHLMAVWNVAQVDRDSQATRSVYEELLKEQLEYWPAAESAAQASVWLGALCESQQRWQDAIAAYGRVGPDSGQFAVGVTGLGNCWLRRLAEIQDRTEQLQLGEEAREFMEELLLTSGFSPGSPPLAPLAQVAILTARLHLQYGGKAERAEQLLGSVLAADDGLDDPSRSDAQALLVVAMAIQPQRHVQAFEALDRLGEAPAGTFYEMLLALRQIESAASAETRRNLAQLELKSLEILAPSKAKLTTQQQTQLEAIRAGALLAIGKREEALTVLAKLASVQPNDAQIQREYAQLLLDGTNRESWQLALDQWRRVASKCPPQSELWFRAKFSVALAQFRLGEKQQAAQLIRFLKETPPGLAKSPLEAAFLELLAQCEAK